MSCYGTLLNKNGIPIKHWQVIGGDFKKLGFEVWKEFKLGEAMYLGFTIKAYDKWHGTMVSLFSMIDGKS
jgi:hypothetical protein